METTGTKKTNGDLKMPDKTDDDMAEGLRLLFRHKYVQAEPVSLEQQSCPPPDPSCPEA